MGGLWSIGLMVVRKAGRRSRIPFGPWMILGAAIGVAAGEGLWELYLGALDLSGHRALRPASPVRLTQGAAGFTR